MGEKPTEGQIMAKARDTFVVDNPDLFALETLGSDPKYLRNRIENAFCAGYDQGLHAQKENNG